MIAGLATPGMTVLDERMYNAPETILYDQPILYMAW